MKYRVRLLRPPLYATTVEVAAAWPEEAREQAIAAGEFARDLAGDGPIDVDYVEEVKSAARLGGGL